jgi:hypothetical protein
MLNIYVWYTSKFCISKSKNLFKGEDNILSETPGNYSFYWAFQKHIYLVKM